MKHIILTILCCTAATASIAQKQTYGLATFVSPKGWKKEVKENTYTCFSITNKATNSYCQIFVMLNIKSKGSIGEDFEQEWKTLIATPYKIEVKPEATAPEKKGDLTMKSGIAPFAFNNGTSAALLTTITAYGQAVSVVSLTNSTDYQTAIEEFLARRISCIRRIEEAGNKRTSRQIFAGTGACKQQVYFHDN
jgi:hypothetical protein